MKALTFILAFLCFIADTTISEAALDLPERRRDQFTTESGHIIIPAPYSLKGIGSGVALLASVYNIRGSNTDLFAAIMTGDISGIGGGMTDYHIIKKRLFFDLTFQNLNKAVFQSYRGRGMDTSKNDYSLVEIDNMLFTGARLTLSFEERMFEIYAQGYDGRFKIGSLRDSDGNVIVETQDSDEVTFNLYALGMMLDMTDDRSDPRKGVRYDMNVGWSPPRDGNNADYSVIDNSLTGYLPVGKRSTWVFNLFRSDAIVSSEGETDRAKIGGQLGFQCGLIPDPAKKAACYQSTSEYIDNIVAANKYGSSSSLGGRSRLRSYSRDRFKGAHTAFIGTELRWNITSESKPYDIWFVKDVRTGIQAAFFHETGTVSETEGDLWKRTRSSTGAGLRMVNASGLIYRLDVATGDEGPSVVLIINYPWEAF